jgi:hypothetical protein
MQNNNWQVGLLLIIAAIAGGCDVGRADKGGGGGGGAAPVPENIAEDYDIGRGEDPLPENIDGTYVIDELNDQGTLYPADKVVGMQSQYRKVIFADGMMTTFAGGKPLVEKVEIDRTRSPAQATFTEELPAGASNTTFGVMAAEGGQLIVCRFVGRRLPTGQRPTQITNGRDYVTWKLKKENADQ